MTSQGCLGTSVGTSAGSQLLANYREEATMVWVWGKPLSVTEDLLACPLCGAAIPAGDSQQLHHQWHEKTDTV